MVKRLSPETVALIRALRAKGYEVSEIVRQTGASERSVQRYLGLVPDVPRPDEVKRPLFDPHRDEVPDMPLTARLCGDPIPGRRELVAANRDASYRPSATDVFDPGEADYTWSSSRTRMRPPAP